MLTPSTSPNIRTYAFSSLHIHLQKDGELHYFAATTLIVALCDQVRRWIGWIESATVEAAVRGEAGRRREGVVARGGDGHSSNGIVIVWCGGTNPLEKKTGDGQRECEWNTVGGGWG